MFVINFSHPLTERQQRRLEELTGTPIARVIERPAQFDNDRPYAEQARELVDAAGLTADDWQRERLLVVPPSLAAIACCVLCELHGRTGYFLPLARLRPVPGSVPPEFEVAEVIDLHELRNAARIRRDVSP